MKYYPVIFDSIISISLGQAGFSIFPKLRKANCVDGTSCIHSSLERLNKNKILVRFLLYIKFNF